MSPGGPLCVVAPFQLPSETLFDVSPEQGMGKSMLGAVLKLAVDDAGTMITLRPRRLSDLEPEALVNHIAELKILMQTRAALTAAKGPLACEVSVRRKLFAGLGDEPARCQLRQRLGLPPSQRLSAADIYRPGPAADELRQNLMRLVIEAEGLERKVAYVDELLEASRIYPGSSDYELGSRALSAIILQSLDRDWLRVKPDRDAIVGMIAQLDEALTVGCRRAMQHPEYRGFEQVWRAVQLLVARGERVIGISCEAKELGAKIVQLAAPFRPRALAVLHPIDPRVDAELVSAMAPLDVPCVFQARDEVVDALRGERERATVLRGWIAARKSAYARLCLSNYLFSLPFGNDAIPVKSFNFEELPADQAPDAWLRYAPAAGLVAASFLGDAKGPVPVSQLIPYRYLAGEAILTAAPVLPPSLAIPSAVAASFGLYQLGASIAGSSDETAVVTLERLSG